MVISTRTPEGWPNDCPVCGYTVTLIPSQNTLDAPCPICGHLLWFTEGKILAVWDATSGSEGCRSEFDPDTIAVAECVLELIPESVARECVVVPVAESADAILIAVASPIELMVIDKLEFILNRRVLAVATRRDWVVGQIEKWYGSAST